MSITTPDDRISTYNPVVATTTFAALFPVFDNSDLSVFVDGVERNDFTVSATYINNISNDAAVVFSPGIVGEVKVIGTRDPRRISRFLDGAPLPTRDQNTALDVVMASLQELARDVKRAVKVGFGAIGFNVDTTGIADNSVLMFKGNKVVVGPTAGDVANAQTNAASAADSAIKAQKWADNPQNQEVIAGRFSAMHWALKALEWASAGVAGVSSFNGRTGSVTPQTSDYPGFLQRVGGILTGDVQFGPGTGGKYSKMQANGDVQLNRGDNTGYNTWNVTNAYFGWDGSRYAFGPAGPVAVSGYLEVEAAGVSAKYYETGDHTFSGATAAEFGATLSAALRPFKSGNQPYVVNGLGSVGHGLGRKPSKLSSYLVCTTASNGYAVGDEVEVAAYVYNNGNNWGITMWADSNNLYWKIASSGLAIIHRANGTVDAAPAANFALRVRGAL